MIIYIKEVNLNLNDGIFWSWMISLYLFLLCGFYMLIGPALILLNKHILHDLDFPYPMFLSGLGVLVSGLVAQLLVRLGYVVLQRKEQVEGIYWLVIKLLQFPTYLSFRYKRVLPVGLAHASTLALGNIVYLLLNVGFIQMLKSFTPVIIMVTSILFQVESPTNPVILSVIVICIGTALTCSYTAEASFIGLTVMFFAEFAEAIRLVITQFLLQNLKFGVVEGQFVLAPASAFWLFLASLIFEFKSIYVNGAMMRMVTHPGAFLMASCMGLGVNFLSYLVIQATSSLTMKVLGTLRNILTIFLGILFYSESVTLSEFSGYSVALFGVVLYNLSKSGQLDTYFTSWGIPLYLSAFSTYERQINSSKKILDCSSDDDSVEQRNKLSILISSTISSSSSSSPSSSNPPIPGSPNSSSSKLNRSLSLKNMTSNFKNYLNRQTNNINNSNGGDDEERDRLLGSKGREGEEKGNAEQNL